MMRRLFALGAFLVLLSGCGGHGGGSGASTAPTTPTAPTAPVLTNFTTVTVDGGPAALQVGPNGYLQANVPYVSVTLCAPGASNCQTIDHVLLDTGSVGLRVEASVLTPALLSALPNQTSPTGDPVGECYGFVDGYVFGSVRRADFQIGGESVSDMPVQVVADSGQFATAPSSCSNGGGTALNTVQALGANAILGIGVTTTDCGISCTTNGGEAAAAYFDCPASGCAAIIGRSSTTVAPFQQLPNPVAAMAVDNNGTIISLPAVAASGAATVTGTLYFGIGTQTNNALGSATVIAATGSSSPEGSGLITAIYNGQTLNDSFVDSGSSEYLFADGAIALCTQADIDGLYCPASPLTVNVTVQGVASGTGAAGASANAAFPLYNAQTLLATNFSALPGVGGNPMALGLTHDYPDSFDFGLPFFFGRNVYTAIEGRVAGSAVGPYIAF